MCTVTNCNKPNHGNGLCNMHYRRFYRRGTTELNRPSTIQRFKRFVDSSNINGCHIWTGFRGHGGYGIIRISRRNVLAHRYSWEFKFSPIPKGLLVLHKCNNPPCVNVKHLYLGTQFDNKQDEIRNGNNIHGEKHPSAKLTDKKVIEIRKQFHNKILNRKDLAKQFHISYESIVKIIARESWKHI